MTKNKALNLGTFRDSDDNPQPTELPTVYPAGTRPIAPWANMTSSEEGVVLTHTEERVLLVYGGTSDASLDGPPTHEISSEIAHTRVKLSPQAKRAAARENHGGGPQGRARKDVED